MAIKKIGTARYFRLDTSVALNTIVAPAANTKGVRVVNGFANTDTVGSYGSLMVKASAAG